MKRADNLTNNIISIKLINNIRNILLEQKDTDEVGRILSTLLAENTIQSWVEAGQKLDEGSMGRGGRNGKVGKILNEMSILNCFDHYGVFTEDENQYPEIEPYHLRLDDLKEIVTFCDKNNLDVFIDGESPHFPGRTILVVFSDKNE